MSKIKRNLEIVVKFKRGMNIERLAWECGLKRETIERIIRDWLNDIAIAATRKYKTQSIVKYGLPWVRISKR